MLDAKFGWLPTGCEDLAKLTREQWDEVVRGAEERWSRVANLKMAIASWYKGLDEDRQEPGENEELVFYAGDQRANNNGWMTSMFPIIDLVAMPIPRTLTEIGSDIRAKEPDERTLLLNPILVAIRDQHDEAGGAPAGGSTDHRQAFCDGLR